MHGDETEAVRHHRVEGRAAVDAAPAEVTRSLRELGEIGTVALIGALTAFIAGEGEISLHRVGWFVAAAIVGFSWLAIGQRLILPDDPTSSLDRCVRAFGRRAGETVALAATASTPKALRETTSVAVPARAPGMDASPTST